MEVYPITQEVDVETRLQRTFERLIEIKHQKNLLEQEEQQIKDDAFDYLTGVAHATAGRFVANGVTADVYVSYRPQCEYDAEELQKIKHLEEQLSQAKKAGIIIHQTPYLVVRIVQ
jgi:predicted RNA-binding protein (virulence factor B family)